MLSSLCMDVWSSHLCRIRHHISHHHHHIRAWYVSLALRSNHQITVINFYEICATVMIAKPRVVLDGTIYTFVLMCVFCFFSSVYIPNAFCFAFIQLKCIAFLIFKISSFFIWYFRDRVTGADHHTNEWMTLTHTLRNAKHTDDKQSQNNE